MNTPLFPLQFDTYKTIIKEHGFIIYAGLVGFVYASGFIVLNSNLANSNVIDIEFVNARYFLAGANFVFYLACFYLFAGRAVIFGKNWYAHALERLGTTSVQRPWQLLIFFHSLLGILFFCCISAATFTSIAIDGGVAETWKFYIALFMTFFATYTLDVTSLESRFPRIAEIATIVLKIISVSSFFYKLENKTAIVVFASYFGGICFIAIVSDVAERYKRNADQFIFTAVYSVVFLIGAAVSYGTQFFSQVSLKFGGARAQSVSIGITEDALSGLPKNVADINNRILNGSLIHQTSNYFYLLSHGNTIRLRSNDVVTMVSKPSSAKDAGKPSILKD